MIRWIRDEDWEVPKKDRVKEEDLDKSGREDPPFHESNPKGWGTPSEKDKVKVKDRVKIVLAN